MATESIHLRVSGELRRFVDFRTGDSGVYETPSEYVRDLIRRDKEQYEKDGWAWLRKELHPAIDADEQDFLTVTAEQVSQRCRRIRKA